MLLVVPTLIAIAVALLCGGSLRGLATLPIRSGELIMASFGIQVLVYLPGLRSSAIVTHWGAIIYLGALVLACAGIMRNWHLGAPARIALIGLALNATVIALNGGHMPVNAAAMGWVQGVHKVREIADPHLYGNTWLASRSTRLVALSDVLPVRLPGGYGNVYSVGDLLITLGVATLAYRAIRRPTPAESQL